MLVIGADSESGVKILGHRANMSCGGVGLEIPFLNGEGTDFGEHLFRGNSLKVFLGIAVAGGIEGRGINRAVAVGVKDSGVAGAVSDLKHGSIAAGIVV